MGLLDHGSIEGNRRVQGEVAIIGMACVFPKAPNLQAYWQNIISKVDAIGNPPKDRGIDEFFDPHSTANDRIYCKRGGYLEESLWFNPVDYGIMPVAVDGAEPEHFMALKIAHDALVDAGFPEKPLNRERTEVILGRGTYVSRGYVTVLQQGLAVDQTIRLLRELHPEYSTEELESIKQRLKANLPPFNAETAPGLVPSIMAGLIANRLDLGGPNFVVDAACASALIALERGVQDLLAGRCDAVLTGGVQIATSAFIHMVFSQLGALSRRPQLSPFGVDADGTMLGEGLGMVVLKRREDAERDGHRIYALIKGIGSSSDGRAKGILAPRVEGEELALRRAYEAAGVSPTTIELIEAHGTALPLGDITEIQALRRVFGSRDGGSPRCAIGSVKSMIGHLIPAAGIAGLIKTALALYHKILPPTLHCDTPNPKLELEKTPFYINAETRPWVHGLRDTPRQAGVNAFGFGGINAHVVLEEYRGGNEADTEVCNSEWETELCVFQGESRQDLIEQCKGLHQYLSRTGEGTMLDVAHTLNEKLDDRPYRLAIVASSREDLNKKLNHAIERLGDSKRARIKDRVGIYFFEKPLAREGRLAFLFPGEGSQYPDMLADLCLHFPEVRSCFDTLDRAFADHPRNSLPSHSIFPLPNGNGGQRRFGEDELWQMDYAVDAVLTADRALFKLFHLLEIHPHVITGHSSGEIMALEAAGAVELSGEQERMQYILAGYNMIQRFAATEAIPEAPLVAVGVEDRTVIYDIIRKSAGKLFIAMDNCPNQAVICCDKEIVDEVMDQLRDAGAICQILPFARPYHTPLFEPASKSLEEFFGSAKIVPPIVEIFSCMTAMPMPSDPKEVRKLAVGQWAHQVRFRETVESMYEAGVRLFVEIGPKSNLASFVNDILKGKPHLAVASNVHHRSGITQLNHALGLLVAHGVSMRLDYLYKRRRPRELDLEMTVETQTAHKPQEGAMKLSVAVPVLSLGVKGQEGLEETVPSSRKGLKVVEPNHRGLPARGIATTRTTKPDTEYGSDSPGQSVPRHEAKNRHSQIIQRYLQTMEQFLNVQQEVMQAYLARTGSREPRIPDVGPAQAKVPSRQFETQIADEAKAAAAAAVFSDRVHEGPGRSVLTDTVLSSSTLMSGDPSVFAKPVLPSRESIEKLLFSLVSEKTGYPINMLKLDQELEADLGIDSIKRVEILGALNKKGLSVSAGEMDLLAGLKTFQQIIDFYGERQKGSKGDVESSAPLAGVRDPSPMPLVGTIISHTPGEELSALREFNLDEDIFLLDHTLGRHISVTDPELTGLPIMPLTMSMEILAEAAALLLPSKLCIGMKDIRAYRWITFEKSPVTLRVEARRQSAEEVHVQIRDDDNSAAGKSPGLPIVEGTVVFGDQYPNPPVHGDFTLQERQASTLTKERLYSEGMFMGPSFQGVASVDWKGEDGIEATLRVLPFPGFFKSQGAPRFLLDPVVLDAAGQLVGYWILEQREMDFNNVYPFRVGALQIYGPNLRTPEQAKGKAKIKPLAENQLRSNIDVIGPAGDLRMRLISWDDRLFNLPAQFHELRYKPREVMLSTHWPAPISGFQETGAIECRRMEDFPHNLLHSHGMMWQHALAHLALSRREREIWRGLPGLEKRRTEWLLARVAGKDAIRLFLKKQRGIELCLPDVEIEPDTHGRPIVNGAWTKEIDRVPSLSLAHTRGIGVAVVSELGEGCGIDVEWLDPCREGMEQIAFNPEERDLLKSTIESQDREWPLRIWCAKEAMAKALGRGLIGTPRDLTARELDPVTGVIRIELSGKLAQIFPELNGMRLQVYTFRDRDLVVASAILNIEQGTTHYEERECQ